VFRECLAEFIGTAVIIIFGNGVVAAVQMTDDDKVGTFETMQFINVAWGFGVTFGIMASFDTSGAHLNCAVTLNAMILGGFSITKGLWFMAAQTLGAFFGALVVTLDYVVFKGGNALTNFYCTAPAPGVSFLNASFNEFLGTFILMFSILGITNGRPKFNKFHVAGFVGALVFGIGNALGAQTGYAINPARDFGPRMCYLIFAIMYGKDDLWSVVMGDGYFIVPIVFPLLGALAAGISYKHGVYLDTGEQIDEAWEIDHLGDEHDRGDDLNGHDSDSSGTP